MLGNDSQCTADAKALKKRARNDDQIKPARKKLKLEGIKPIVSSFLASSILAGRMTSRLMCPRNHSRTNLTRTGRLVRATFASRWFQPRQTKFLGAQSVRPWSMKVSLLHKHSFAAFLAGNSCDQQVHFFLDCFATTQVVTALLTR
jgi:hypothetical protein